MTLASLVETLEAGDIWLYAADGNLDIDAPVGALTPQLRTALKALKPQLIRFLCGLTGAGHSRIAQWPHAAQDAFEERSAIYEYEAGLVRQEAERQAWEDVVRPVRAAATHPGVLAAQTELGAVLEAVLVNGVVWPKNQLTTVTGRGLFGGGAPANQEQRSYGSRPTKTTITGTLRETALQAIRATGRLCEYRSR